MKKNTFCQSCGIPLKKDPKGGGTEQDGSRSEQYCSMCYEDGRFLTPPEITTAEQMQKYCIQQMTKKGTNRMIAWLATRGIPKLRRWKK